jgi:mono/diheme cytochrome c family protein
MRAWGLVAGLALAACVPAQDVPTGAEDFAIFCAGCHGTGGTGDGPAAAGLAKRPADLTRLAAGNGGVFPGTRVMAKIWGYTGQPDGSPMPAFAPLLDGQPVPYDGGDGIATPTPVRLVGLAEYLRSIQN